MFFIPELGTTVSNPNDWTFDLYYEGRNDHLLKVEGFSQYTWKDHGKVACQKTFPVGSVFVVDRIYIRKGAEDFSSVSLICTQTTCPKLLRAGLVASGFGQTKAYGRFWVKLDDFNKANFQPYVTAPHIPIWTPITVGKLKRIPKKGLKVKVTFVDPTGVNNYSNIEKLYPIEGFSVPPTFTVSNGLFIKSVKKNSLHSYVMMEPKYLACFVDYRAPIGLSGPAVPLHKDFLIPASLQERKKMGLAKDKDEIKNLPINGGLLTIEYEK